MGKVALITGGASGIGRASALLFAREGAKVMIADINDQMAEETIKLAEKAGSEVRYVHTDVSRVSDLEKMVRDTVKTFGKLNIFWHNAGNAGPGTIEQTSEQDFDKTIAIHVKGGFFGAKYCIPEIRKTGGGSILFTASLVALKPSKRSPTYSMAKASLVMLTKSLALSCGKDNIRVNCICPGLIETPLTPAFLGSDSPTASFKNVAVQTVPLGGKPGQPEYIAQTALFLVSDAASYITGAIVSVDGGVACT